MTLVHNPSAEIYMYMHILSCVMYDFRQYKIVRFLVFFWSPPLPLCLSVLTIFPLLSWNLSLYFLSLFHITCIFLFPLKLCFTWSLYTYLVSVVMPCCLLAPEDLELGTEDSRKYVVFVFLDLGYIT